MLNTFRHNTLYFFSHSGGKDSQAQYLVWRSQLPQHAPVWVLHASLRTAEWSGIVEHIENTVHDPVIVVEAFRETGEFNDIRDYIERRGMFPTPKKCFGTSDLKRSPCDAVINAIMNGTTKSKAALEADCLKYHRPEYKQGWDAVLILGMRSQEGEQRAKAEALRVRKHVKTKDRTIWEWLPIKEMLTHEVYRAIKEAGQEPHPVYYKGMTRLSCKVCVCASKEDFYISSKIDPENFQKYVDLEVKTGHTLRKGKTLPELIAQAEAEGAEVKSYTLEQLISKHELAYFAGDAAEENNCAEQGCFAF